MLSVEGESKSEIVRRISQKRSEHVGLESIFLRNVDKFCSKVSKAVGRAGFFSAAYGYDNEHGTKKCLRHCVLFLKGCLWRKLFEGFFLI